jgi:gas vesicle protein
MRRMLGFMIGIMVGWLVGSTIALLLAPETGDMLRGRIRERGSSFAAEIKMAVDARRAEMEQRLAALREPRQPSA